MTHFMFPAIYNSHIIQMYNVQYMYISWVYVNPPAPSSSPPPPPLSGEAMYNDDSEQAKTQVTTNG